MATANLPASPLLNEKQAAEMLGVSPGTLSVWRCNRRISIPYTKIGRCVRYDRAQLENYIRQQTVGGDSSSQ